LTIIEGSASVEGSASTNSTNNRQHFTNKADRRRRSSSLAQSDQIRDIIAKTVAELNNNNNDNCNNTASRKTAEDRLKQVLADVKEKGYSSERIFSTIGKASSESAQDELIPKDTFVQGLKKLGCKCTDEEDLEFITDRFDKNQDGFISLVEFQQYCYNINSVGWKAEKQRLEAEKHSDGNCIEESRFDIREIKYASTDVYSTSKLYWKDNISVNITLRYCSDLDIITLQIQNVESKDDYTPLFIKKSDIAIDKSALDETTSLAVQTSDAKTDEDKEQVRQQKHWETYSSYLVTRLQLKDGACRLVKLTGDEFEKLDIPKPSNLLVPQQKRNERVSAADSVTAGKTIEDEFNNLSVKLTSESRSARNSRQDAQELSSVVESVLTEIYAEDIAAAAADLE